MIDYSVYMQSFPFDEAAAPKAYAKAQMRESMTFKKFVEHVASHGAGYSKGTVEGIVSDLCACIVEQLLNGNKVQLGDLGNFWISLSSDGADTMAEFTADNIRAVNIIFTPGEEFENLIGKATFNVVASRIAQAATLKTEKAGGTTVDLAAAKAATKGDAGDGDTSGSGGGTTDDTEGGGSALPGDGGY
ncbi:MAG: HU family DNA-binding protein [Bacteroidales bacterium]|nr:HU family DNA-binding protein [Bacteroidales bacterium]